MNSYLTIWIRGYATWAAILILSAATFIALIADGVVLPLVLVGVAAGLVIFRYWAAIKAFDLAALDEWARARMGSIGIREWHTPYHAAELFCDPTIVRARNEAALKANSIMMELIKDPSRNVGAPVEADLIKIPEQEQATRSRSNTAGRHADYEAAQASHDQNNIALSRDLLTQLIAGNLMAKGSPTQNDTTQSERIIPTSRWRIMSLDISKAEASGGGLHYIGIVIGKKPGRETL